MGITIGGVDVAQSIIEAEFKIGVLEKIVEKLLARAPGALSDDEYKAIRKSVMNDLKKKYPEAGISLKPK